jgi:hypothetical protein
MKRFSKFLSCMTAMAIMSPLAMADEDVVIADDDPSVSSYEDEFDFLVEGERNAAQMANQAGTEEDDFAMWDDEEGDDFGEFQLRVPDPEPALPLPYSIVGRKPLADNYGASLVFSDRDSVVAELPVLIARNPTDFAADFWLIGELHVNGTKVAETRQMVTAASLAQGGPTVAFLKMMAPVPSKSGELEFKVIKSSDGQAREDLFRKVLPFEI